jgi:exoribonuclease R
MDLTREQLEGFASIGVFKPNGLNDDRRDDLTLEAPFLAVDDLSAFEIDDAIRVRQYCHGGFTVEVAIADGSQLADSPDIVSDAITARWSEYGLSSEQTVPMLPLPVIRQLELRGREPVRALVVRRDYTDQARVAGPITIKPAFISVENITPQQLTTNFSGRYQRRGEQPVVRFARIWGEQLRRNNSRVLEREGSYKCGAHVVEAYMALANSAFPHWAKAQAIPIPFRSFDPTQPTWDQARGEHVAYGHYTHNPEPHHMFRHLGSLYMHMTSPLRRAPDLVTHIQVGSFLAGRELPYDQGDIQDIVAYMGLARAQQLAS